MNIKRKRLFGLLILLTVTMLTAGQVQSGPGILGGNPQQTVINVRHNYNFSATTPSELYITSDSAYFKFQELGADLIVEKIEPLLHSCPPQAIAKSICTLDDSATRNYSVITFSNGSTFLVDQRKIDYSNVDFKELNELVLDTFNLNSLTVDLPAKNLPADGSLPADSRPADQ